MNIYTSVVDKYTKRYRLKSLIGRGLRRYLFKRLMRTGFISYEDFIYGIGWWKLMYKKRNLFRFLFFLFNIIRLRLRQDIHLSGGHRPALSVSVPMGLGKFLVEIFLHLQEEQN